MEDETLIGDKLFLAGIIVISIGFLLITFSTILGIFQTSRSGQDYSETDPFEENPASGRNQDSEIPPYGRPPEKKVESRVRGGGVIMIGPIPIIFGTDRGSAKTAIILAIVLMILSFLFLRGFSF
ncbi:MAG: TIGR00304 family membrane protein [Methanosarcina sp.]